MNYSEVISGSLGHTAAGFAKSTLASQCNFWLGVAVARSQNPKNDVPVFDASTVEAMGDQGLPTPVKLDLEELLEASAAGFLLLARHIKTPNPENGRKEEFLTRFLKDAKMVIQANSDFTVSREVQRTEANAKMLKADPTKRIEAIKTEAQTRTNAIIGPMQEAWTKNLKELQDGEDSYLADLCCEALVNAGRDVAGEIKKAANTLIDSQRVRFEEGKFAAVDAGIYALAQ